MNLTNFAISIHVAVPIVNTNFLHHIQLCVRRRGHVKKCRWNCEWFSISARRAELDVMTTNEYVSIGVILRHLLFHLSVEISRSFLEVLP